jgi:hypothetical protein
VRNAVDPHWPGDVLDLLIAHVLEGEIEFVAHLIADDPADADPTWLGQSLQPRCDIHPVAEDVVLLNNHVTEVHPNAEGDALILGGFGIALRDAALDLYGAPDGVNHAGELGEKAVAGVLHYPAVMLGDLGIDQLPEVRLEAFVRPLLIRPHQARIPCHIGGEDRGEAADGSHLSVGGRLAYPNLP